MARVVRLHHDVPSIGVDHHDGLYYVNLLNGGLAPIAPPYIPVPGPWFSQVHAVMTSADWYVIDDKSNPTVLADSFSPVVSVDHAARMNGHVPAGLNILLPIIILLSETGWKLAVSTVVSTQGPLASTVAGPVGVNINCADPISMPCAAFGSPGTVHISPTGLDFVRAAVEWAATELINLVVQAGMGKAGKFGAEAAERALSRTWLKERYLRDAVRFMDRGATKLLGKRWVVENVGDVLREAAKKRLEKFGGDAAKDQLQDWGIGPSNVRTIGTQKRDER